MKKFISWVSAIAVLVSVVSCKEIEEAASLPEEVQNQTLSAKESRDSVIIKNENQTGVPSALESGGESDPPPKKDEIKW